MAICRPTLGVLDLNTRVKGAEEAAVWEPLVNFVGGLPAISVAKWRLVGPVRCKNQGRRQKTSGGPSTVEGALPATFGATPSCSSPTSPSDVDRSLIRLVRFTRSIGLDMGMQMWGWSTRK